MNVTDSVAWATVPLIDDGDPLSNAEFLATAQALANRTAYLREAIPGKAVSLAIDIPLVASLNVSSRFTQVGSAGNLYWSQTSVADTGPLWFTVTGRLPKFGKIDSVTVQILGGGSGGLPGTMPSWSLNRTGRVNGSAYPPTTAAIASATDASGSLGAFQVSHGITAAGINHTILTDSDYNLRVFGEAGANAAGIILISATIVVIPT